MANLLLLEWRIDFALRGGGGKERCRKTAFGSGIYSLQPGEKLNEKGSQLTHHTLYALISMVIKTLAFK